MKQRFAALSLIIYAAFSLVLPSQADPQPKIIHQAEYQGLLEGFTLKLQRQLLELAPGQYRLQATASHLLGQIQESEDFSWENNQLKPSHYHYAQNILGVSRQRQIDYDWAQGLATYQDRKTNKQLPLSSGVLGPMTYQLQLQLDLLNQQDTLSYRFIRRGKIKHYTFATIDQRPLTRSPNQLENTLYLTRSNEDANRATYLWMDANDHYTLAGLEQLEDDKANHALFILSSQYLAPLPFVSTQVLAPAQ